MAPDLFQKFAGVVLRPFLPTDIGWAYEIETHPSIIQRFRLAGSTPNMALGVGGLLGSYTGARLQPRLPEVLIRRVLGLLVLAIGIRYAWLGLATPR